MSGASPEKLSIPKHNDGSRAERRGSNPAWFAKSVLRLGGLAWLPLVLPTVIFATAFQQLWVIERPLSIA